MDFQKSGFVGGMFSGNGMFFEKKIHVSFWKFFVEYPR